MYFYRMNLYFFGFEKSEFRTVMTTQTGAESVESLHKGMAIKQTVVNVFWVRFSQMRSIFFKDEPPSLQFSSGRHGNGGGKNTSRISRNKRDRFKDSSQMCCCCCCKIFQWTTGEGCQPCLLRNFFKDKMLNNVNSG